MKFQIRSYNWTQVCPPDIRGGGGSMETSSMQQEKGLKETRDGRASLKSASWKEESDKFRG